MKTTLLALFLYSFILIGTVKGKYKDLYCGRQDYILTPKELPHLHCTPITFTIHYGDFQNKKYEKFVDGGKVKCNRVLRVLNHPNIFGAFYRFDAIGAAIIAFGMGECLEDMGKFKREQYNDLKRAYQYSKTKKKRRKDKEF
uniref:Uncharacterized protein n=1 Tax=Amphimedon queenslandica TaxID=400682 RepID=A0A1X7U4N1_AMPQE